MSFDRRRVWHAGEAAALDVYRDRGFVPIARNWRSPLGELDLVLRKGGLVVFCEVKARGSGRLGGGYEAVTPAKQRKLRALAEAFVRAHRLDGARFRFDVASVAVSPDARRPDVHLFEDAF